MTPRRFFLRSHALLRALSLLLAAGFALSPAPSAAQQFELPSGFILDRKPEPSGSQDWTPLFTVRPDEGAFSSLSSIAVSEVEGPVEDPGRWLAARLSAQLPEGTEMQKLFDSPDSPFNDPVFDSLQKALPELFGGLERLGELPLEFCDPPTTGYNASGKFTERFCTFSFGPIRKYLVLRLQRLDEGWYYTQISTMNERRLRDLLAIADTFHVRT